MTQNLSHQDPGVTAPAAPVRIAALADEHAAQVLG